mgnify:CR=1 FL=1
MSGQHEFSVGRRYKNRKGVYEVVSICGDEMVIRWDTGEQIATSINLQVKILQNMEKKPQEIQLDIQYSDLDLISRKQEPRVSQGGDLLESGSHLQTDTGPCPNAEKGPSPTKSVGVRANPTAVVLGLSDTQGRMWKYDDRVSFQVSDVPNGIRIAVRLDGRGPSEGFPSLKNEGISVLRCIAGDQAARRGFSIKPIADEEVLHSRDRDTVLGTVYWLGSAVVFFSK